MAMMRVSMRILVLVMCVCTTGCFGMLPHESVGAVTKGEIDVGIDDGREHKGAAETEIAVIMPPNSIMGTANDDNDDMGNDDNVAVMDSAAADGAQEEPPSLDGRMVRVKEHEVSCVDNG